MNTPLIQTSWEFLWVNPENIRNLVIESGFELIIKIILKNTPWFKSGYQARFNPEEISESEKALISVSILLQAPHFQHWEQGWALSLALPFQKSLHPKFL